MQKDDMLSRIEEYFHILHLGEKSLDLGKILSTDTSINILEAVYNSDSKVGLSASEISGTLGIGRTTVIYHLGRMQESGLVRTNPVLEHDANWKKFWDLYRKKRADISKEQFDRLHNARMNGVKLFVPTKKGFLVLPSTDFEAGQSFVKEAMESITAPAVERGYRRTAKTASIFGILGLLLIAFTFLLPGLPFLQMGGGALKAPAFVEEAAKTLAPTTLGPTALAGASSKSPVVDERGTTMPVENGLSDEALLAHVAGEEISNMTQLKNESVPDM